MRMTLVPLDGGTPFLVTLPMTLVGSKHDSDIRIEADGVPALSCVLALTDDFVLLRDLDTGGIRVNGQRVRRAVLLPNDRLTIASRDFCVHYEEVGG